MPNFKDQIQRDLRDVFHRTDEHADWLMVEYDGNCRMMPVIMDQLVAKDRKKPASDHAEGISQFDDVAYITLADLGVVPRQGRPIFIDDNQYNILEVGNEAGDLVLRLERYA